MTALDPWYLENLRCPLDHSTLSWDGSRLVSATGCRYPVVDGLPVMLIPEEEQTMGIALASIERARGNANVVDQRAPDFYLETPGTSDEEKGAAGRAGHAAPW